MNATSTPARPRSNLWSLQPRDTTPTAAGTAAVRGTTTIATSLPPSSRCDYWVRRFAGRDLELHLPQVCSQHRIESTAVLAPVTELPAATTERLRALARTELTTPFTVVLAAWQAVLFRHGEQSDFVVGCGAPGGRHSVHERPLLVHATVNGQASFRTLVRAVAMRRAEGATHGDVPLPEIVQAFAPRTSPDRHPLFQVAFVQRNSLTETATHVTDTRHSAPVDLACVWEDNGRTIRIRVEYPAGVIAPDAAARIPVHLANLLRAAMALPDAPIGTLPMLTSAEYIEKARG